MFSKVIASWRQKLGEGGKFLLTPSLLSSPLLSLISTKLIISANFRGPVLYQRERGVFTYTNDGSFKKKP